MTELLSTLDLALLGWVLLHFLWLGAALALLLFDLLHLLSARGPALRYALACAMLLARS